MARAILDEGCVLRFRARGVSMHPFVRDGEPLYVRAVALERVRTGDVLLFERGPARFVAHRVLKRLRGPQSAFFMKGDAAAQPDGWVPADRVLGRVVARERGGRRVDLTRVWWRAAGLVIARLPLLWAVSWRAARHLRSCLSSPVK